MRHHSFEEISAPLCKQLHHQNRGSHSRVVRRNRMQSIINLQDIEKLGLCKPGPSGTIKILGVDRKLIIIIIFAKACIPKSVYAKRVSIHAFLQSGYAKRVSIHAFLQNGYAKHIPTRFLGKRVWKLFYSVFLLRGAYPLFFKACMQSVYQYTLFYKACMQSVYPYTLFYKAGMQSVYPYLLFREACIP
jgi:hypothetical protein